MVLFLHIALLFLCVCAYESIHFRMLLASADDTRSLAQQSGFVSRLGRNRLQSNNNICDRMSESRSLFGEHQEPCHLLFTPVAFRKYWAGVQSKVFLIQWIGNLQKLGILSLQNYCLISINLIKLAMKLPYIDDDYSSLT